MTQNADNLVSFYYIGCVSFSRPTMEVQIVHLLVPNDKWHNHLG